MVQANHRSGKALSVASMLLLHLLLYSGMASLVLRQDHHTRMGAAMLPALVFGGIAALLLPVLARLFRLARRERTSFGSCLRMAPMLLASDGLFLHARPRL